MKQVWYHYTKWEDFQSGMYNEEKKGREERIQLAVQLLSNTDELYKAMTRVVKEWKIATEQTMTNQSINHQAWLGQCACAIAKGVREDETRESWGRLTPAQRSKANKVADIVESEWLEEYLQEQKEDR